MGQVLRDFVEPSFVVAQKTIEQSNTVSQTSKFACPHCQNLLLASAQSLSCPRSHGFPEVVENVNMQISRISSQKRNILQNIFVPLRRGPDSGRGRKICALILLLL